MNNWSKKNENHEWYFYWGTAPVECEKCGRHLSETNTKSRGEDDDRLCEDCEESGSEE